MATSDASGQRKILLTANAFSSAITKWTIGKVRALLECENLSIVLTMNDNQNERGRRILHGTVHRVPTSFSLFDRLQMCLIGWLFHKYSQV